MHKFQKIGSKKVEKIDLNDELADIEEEAYSDEGD